MSRFFGIDHIDMPAPADEGDTRLGGCRNGKPKFGGITPKPLGPAIDGTPSSPFPPERLRGESVKGRLPNDDPMPPDVPDMPPPIGPMVNEGRFPLIIADGRGLKASDPPPDIRAGIIAPNRPANGAIDPEPIDEPDDAPAIPP